MSSSWNRQQIENNIENINKITYRLVLKLLHTQSTSYNLIDISNTHFHSNAVKTHVVIMNNDR